MKKKNYHNMVNTFPKLIRTVGEKSGFCGLFILSNDFISTAVLVILELGFGRQVASFTQKGTSHKS